jgi:hypothetical protein
MRLSVILLILATMTLFSQELDKETVKEVQFKTLTSYELPLEASVYAEEDQIPSIKKVIPEEVKLLDGKKVKIKGFMVPTEYNKDFTVAAFLFAPDQASCCYGKVPELNGFIYSTSEKGVKYMKDVLIEVTGTLYTEPKFYKKEECVLIYTMKIESVQKLDYKGPTKGVGF